MKTKSSSEIAYFALVALAALAYLPALSGSFLFDDFANLPALGRYGPIDSLDAILRYVTSGIADPTGRPVSMLSFLIDARDWPADPWPFKRTNLVIHLLNGTLLYIVLRMFGDRLSLGIALARQAALGGAALWLMHPLWVSTVAYVIQRHAMLPVTFVLLGIVLWVRAVRFIESGHPGRGWTDALISVGVCGLLAGLSKANGFLLPILLLVLQLTALRSPSSPHAAANALRRATVLLLVLPSALIVGYLLWRGIGGWDQSHGRPWLLYQRLLTQPRALLDYLGLLALPRVHSPGLFADGFVVSRNLWQPWTTLPALIVMLSAPVFAWFMRKRRPVLSAALLFFLAGHLLESTTVPLELYFEHRNYLPALLLGWPIALGLLRPGSALQARRLLLIVLILALAVVTFARSSLWGDSDALALTWAENLPASARAQTNAANQELAAGRPDLVIQRLAPLHAQRPDEAQFALTLVDAECALGEVSDAALAGASRAIRATGVRSDMVHRWLRGKFETVNNTCAGLDQQSFAALLEAAREHPVANKMTLNRLAQLGGLLAARGGQCHAALSYFNAGLLQERHAAQVHGQMGVLAMRCGPQFALDHLGAYRATGMADTPARAGMLRVHQWLLVRQGHWQRELHLLEGILVQELQDNSSAKTK